MPKLVGVALFLINVKPVEGDCSMIVDFIIALSKYKAWTFGISGIMIVIAGIMRWQARNAPCPIDPKQAKACTRLRKISGWMYWVSVAVWCVGFFFAFVAVQVFY